MENNDPSPKHIHDLMEVLGLYNYETLNAKNPEGRTVETQFRFRTQLPHFGVQVLFSQRTENSRGEKVGDAYVTVELIQMTAGQPQLHPQLNMSRLAAKDLEYLEKTVVAAIAQAEEFTNTYLQLAFNQQQQAPSMGLQNNATKYPNRRR